MPEPLTGELRGELVRTLETGLRAVLADYAAFAASGEVEPDPSRFGRRHNAARSALGHLEALLRLQRQLQAGGTGEPGGSDEAALLARALARLGEAADEAA